METTSLRNATFLAVRECGTEVLGNPRRFMAYITDLIDTDSPAARVLYTGCDEKFLAFYYDVLQKSDAALLKNAAVRAADYLQTEYVLNSQVATAVARSIAMGCADACGIRGVTFEVAAAPEPARQTGSQGNRSAPTRRTPVSEAPPVRQSSAGSVSHSSATSRAGSAPQGATGGSQGTYARAGSSVSQPTGWTGQVASTAQPSARLAPTTAAKPRHGLRRLMLVAALLLVVINVFFYPVAYGSTIIPERGTVEGFKRVTYEKYRVRTEDGSVKSAVLLHNGSKKSIKLTGTWPYERVLSSGEDGLLITGKKDFSEAISSTSNKPFLSDKLRWAPDDRGHSFSVSNNSTSTVKVSREKMLLVPRYGYGFTWYYVDCSRVPSEDGSRLNVTTNRYDLSDFDLYVNGVKIAPL